MNLGGHAGVTATQNAPSRRPGGALGLLPEFKTTTEAPKAKPKLAKRTPVQGLSGGANQSLIQRHLAHLYERAKAGETVAIITRVGVRDEDKRFIQGTIAAIHEDANERLRKL